MQPHPELYVANDLHVADGLKTLVITNPDNSTATTNFALKRQPAMSAFVQGNVSMPGVGCRWNVAVIDLPVGFAPQRHGNCRDDQGNLWFIDDVELNTIHSRWTMHCTLQAGEGVR